MSRPTYKFFVTTTNKLAVRLRSMGRKSELTLPYATTQEKFDIAMQSVQSRRSMPQTELRNIILFYESKIASVLDELIKSGRTRLPVTDFRTRIEIALGLADEATQRGSFYKHFLEFYNSKQGGTAKIYKQTLNLLHAFDANIERLSFEDIDLRWLNRFEAFCAQTQVKNTRNIHLRNIRAVFNNAIDYELTSCYPFRRFKIRAEPTRKRSLSIDELRTLFNMTPDAYAQIYLDAFKLTFMLIGINPVDLYNLTEITSTGRIEYIRAKTHKLYSIKVEPEALEIINKYRGVKRLLSYADRWQESNSFDKYTNKALKYLGALPPAPGRKKAASAWFPELTLYWARHSWATIAAELDVPDAVISQALGHSATNTTTEIYIRRDIKKVDEANRRVLDWVLYNKR